MAQLFGKNYQEAGKSSSPLLLRSNGEIKLQWGNKFIDLIKNGKLNSTSSNYLFTVSSKDDISEDGIYLVLKDNSIWLSLDGNVHQISESGNTYVSFNDTQEVTIDQKAQALTNIGFYYNTLEEAQQAGINNGIIFNIADKKLYLINDGVFTEYINSINTNINTSSQVPIGTIIMYNGTTIPEGWHICDGSNNTPNLIGKFIRANSYVGSEDVEICETTTSDTEETITNTLSAYSLIFIMKYKD